MKRDDQILALRTQNDAARDKLVQTARDRDRALNQPGEVPTSGLDPQDEDAVLLTDGFDPSKIIVIHPGSQNLRIGLASDALPKTIPMCIATSSSHTESEVYEARPRRQFEAPKIEQQYGEEWARKYKKMCEDLKVERRQNKLRVLPNSKELVINYNRRSEPEQIAQHNDPSQVEWTEVAKLEDTRSAAIFGHHALRVADNSNPKFRLFWPMQYGYLHEDDYKLVEHLYGDFEDILTHAMEHELGLDHLHDFKDYSCVFVIPDLHDKRYVEMVLDKCMRWFEFSKICFIQESFAATLVGYTQACVVDVGAQKTSIACVEDGLVIEDSRVNLKYGGYDVTETFMKMLLFDHFPYQEINLRHRYDFLLAEELKQKYCTMNQADVAVQLFTFHLRAPDQNTRKYQFRAYDEAMLAPLGLFDPTIFDNGLKLRGRRKLIERSYNAYDSFPDDPVSGAQLAILALDRPSVAANGTGSTAASQNDVSTPSREKAQPFTFRAEANGTPVASNAPSPAPEGASTPVPVPFVFGGRDNFQGAASPAPSGANGGTPGPSGPGASQSQPQPPPPGIVVEDLDRADRIRDAKDVAAERDSVLPIAPLDTAIMASIHNAAKGDEKKLKEFLGSIMVVGGGSKIPNFTNTLEEKLRAKQRPDLMDRVLVSRSARDMDEQVVVWKGASVFAKLPTNDSWISRELHEFHGARALAHKVMWAW